MFGNRGSVVRRGDDQFASTQICDGRLHGALGEASRFCQHAQTRGDRFPFMPRGLTVKIQINQIGSRLLIVPNQITHQDVEHVIVDRNGLFEARHFERMKEEGRRMK
jgi:hypothetical protein